MPRESVGANHQERVALFIDMSNLYYAARNINIRVDYERLKQFVSRGRSLLRAFAYMGLDPDDTQAQGLVNYLKRYAGYKVITKPLRRYEDGTVKANLDIELAIDMLTIADHVDTLVLVSGDGDFVRLVETVQFKGVRVEVIGLEGNTSTALIEAADEFTNLADIVGDVQKVDRPYYQRRYGGYYDRGSFGERTPAGERAGLNDRPAFNNSSDRTPLPVDRGPSVADRSASRAGQRAPVPEGAPQMEEDLVEEESEL